MKQILELVFLCSSQYRIEFSIDNKYKNYSLIDCMLWIRQSINFHVSCTFIWFCCQRPSSLNFSFIYFRCVRMTVTCIWCFVIHFFFCFFFSLNILLNINGIAIGERKSYRRYNMFKFVFFFIFVSIDKIELCIDEYYIFITSFNTNIYTPRPKDNFI